MLINLQIQNIALIKNLDIDFTMGLNILSGETGAGKSIIIDSLNFVLGKRADKSLISYGEETAKVSAFFNVENCHNVISLLEDMDIDFDDNEVVLQRTMTLDGKNTCRINGQKVSLSMLKEVAVAMTDIYGQHEATGLLDSENHIEILDKYAKNEIANSFEVQKELCDKYLSVKNEIKKYGTLSDVARKLDNIKNELQEIQDAQIYVGEEDELLTLRKKLNNSQSISQSLEIALNALDGDSDYSALKCISEAKSQINSISDYDAEYSEVLDRLDSCKIELKDIAETVNSLLSSSDFNPYEYEKCEQRLAKIRTLKRKYGASEQDILNYAKNLESQIEFFNDAEYNLEKLQKELDSLKNKLSENTTKIHNARVKSAKILDAEVVKQLKELGMNNASFYTQIQICDGEFAYKGNDSVNFMFSANAGQPAKDLSKIISGGELSRFMLAIKNIISDIDGVQTMVFDEIDTGISGHIAQVVAQKMYCISKDKQVLAVTHLPQLAAMADNHYLISKSTLNEKTTTSLTKLDREGSIGEIARLIGGSDYGTYAIPHAKEMKEYSDNYKKSVNL